MEISLIDVFLASENLAKDIRPLEASGRFIVLVELGRSEPGGARWYPRQRADNTAIRRGAKRHAGHAAKYRVCRGILSLH